MVIDPSTRVNGKPMMHRTTFWVLEDSSVQTQHSLWCVGDRTAHGAQCCEEKRSREEQSRRRALPPNCGLPSLDAVSPFLQPPTLGPAPLSASFSVPFRVRLGSSKSNIGFEQVPEEPSDQSWETASPVASPGGDPSSSLALDTPGCPRIPLAFS